MQTGHFYRSRLHDYRDYSHRGQILYSGYTTGSLSLIHKTEEFHMGMVERYTDFYHKLTQFYLKPKLVSAFCHLSENSA